MNILPKKRWHVRTKDNVARVRRDQAQAKEEEQRRLQRVELAEQEARTSFLRQRANVQRQKEGIIQPALSGAEETVHHGHVNFFADLEEQERTFGANKEYEKEKRLEKEAEERRIGLLKYLGEGSSEYMKETPWYQKVPKREAVVTKSTAAVPGCGTQATTSARNITSDSKRKKRAASKERKKKRRRRHSSSSISEEASCGSTSKQSATGSGIDIEKLRAERLRREREERLKTEALMRKMRGEKESQNVGTEQPKQYQQRYSSQFNPDLARQNRVLD